VLIACRVIFVGNLHFVSYLDSIYCRVGRGAAEGLCAGGVKSVNGAYHEAEEFCQFSHIGSARVRLWCTS